MKTTILRCRSCLRLMKLDSRASTRGRRATVWSDGYGQSEPARLHRCGFCRVLVWVEDMPVEGVLEPGKPRSRAWSIARKLHPIGREDFALALREGLGSTPERERFLRLGLWQVANHRDRNGEQGSRPPGRFFRANLHRLGELVEDPLLRAEMLRQQGRFEQALEVLEGLEGALAEEVRRRALDGDSGVFALPRERASLRRLSVAQREEERGSLAGL